MTGRRRFVTSLGIKPRTVALPSVLLLCIVQTAHPTYFTTHQGELRFVRGASLVSEGCKVGWEQVSRSDAHCGPEDRLALLDGNDCIVFLAGRRIAKYRYSETISFLGWSNGMPLVETAKGIWRGKVLQSCPQPGLLWVWRARFTWKAYVDDSGCITVFRNGAVVTKFSEGDRSISFSLYGGVPIVRSSQESDAGSPTETIRVITNQGLSPSLVTSAIWSVSCVESTGGGVLSIVSSSSESNPKTRLYLCRPSAYPMELAIMDGWNDIVWYRGLSNLAYLEHKRDHFGNPIVAHHAGLTKTICEGAFEVLW